MFQKWFKKNGEPSAVTKFREIHKFNELDRAFREKFYNDAVAIRAEIQATGDAFQHDPTLENAEKYFNAAGREFEADRLMRLHNLCSVSIEERIMARTRQPLIEALLAIVATLEEKRRKVRAEEDNLAESLQVPAPGDTPALLQINRKLNECRSHLAKIEGGESDPNKFGSAVRFVLEGE